MFLCTKKRQQETWILTITWRCAWTNQRIGEECLKIFFHARIVITEEECPEMHQNNSKENYVKTLKFRKNMPPIWRTLCASHSCFTLGLNMLNFMFIFREKRKWNEKIHVANAEMWKWIIQGPSIFLVIRYYQSWAYLMMAIHKMNAELVKVD